MLDLLVLVLFCLSVVFLIISLFRHLEEQRLRGERLTKVEQQLEILHNHVVVDKEKNNV